ncbi:hypothetical protein COCC4DRAFT_35145 [Bipolaris maydis ATCC 48331]|uniref:Uncharacterized protein n=2 Tax=Cochliobolus heterostrophus TaxID=5016 RepID=M2THB7_COCH5|nr:uncharacterized protein COCC4DRAFT_35145 [Bipolaris maydis ATCC 48331]EMD85889.1 hypothetical protein COCHEDRAFT_1198429 [Bipolaris maydis C5]KAJ5025138.1 hypothetical protein J3E73DRAFT_325449 [Bipolaris maydis]ENH98763.1 hypothetical protein COCC4DRAFT_35145 [Bipolaris maydis ATCC 48331]KAJ6265148.1 hypothetical protein PSV08DRAFT_345013 [Bipolaris maydis]KAJ6280833.1 hypothetical protein J3E71DRAFT_295891 [Bipolaris maydis]
MRRVTRVLEGSGGLASPDVYDSDDAAGAPDDLTQWRTPNTTRILDNQLYTLQKRLAERLGVFGSSGRVCVTSGSRNTCPGVPGTAISLSEGGLGPI